jgi:predicted HNH restriction endonuclease
MPLELHHKDGNKHNNNLDNLSIICPNCHTFTDTYKSKNKILT